MKYFLTLILFLLLGCELAIKPDLKLGDCVLGENNAIWKYKGETEGKYRFVGWSEEDGDPYRIVDDLSTFKEVECPTKG